VRLGLSRDDAEDGALFSAKLSQRNKRQMANNSLNFDDFTDAITVVFINDFSEVLWHFLRQVCESSIFFLKPN
jgi:hypothetical protein